jgi:hypothetical protein
MGGITALLGDMGDVGFVTRIPITLRPWRHDKIAKEI